MENWSASVSFQCKSRSPRRILTDPCYQFPHCGEGQRLVEQVEAQLHTGLEIAGEERTSMHHAVARLDERCELRRALAYRATDLIGHHGAVTIYELKRV